MHDRQLAEGGVLFVPDYVANAGGVISASAELLPRTEHETLKMVEGIYDTCLKVFRLADQFGSTPLQAAGKLAASILARPLAS